MNSDWLPPGCLLAADFLGWSVPKIVAALAPEIRHHGHATVSNYRSEQYVWTNVTFLNFLERRIVLVTPTD